MAVFTIRALKLGWLITFLFFGFGPGFFINGPASNTAVQSHFIRHSMDDNFAYADDIQLADMDGDNDLDVVAVTPVAGSSVVSWWENQPGDGTSWYEHIVSSDDRYGNTAAFVVNSAGDGADTQPGDGFCDDGTGHCTLRAALMEANALYGIDLIYFNIPGIGPHMIRPLSPLPAVTEGVIIDGFTQPGAQPNSNPAPQGLNTQLKIVLDGSEAGDAFAFTFGLDTPTIDGLVIRGLVIHSFSLGAIGALYEEMYDVINAHFVGNFFGTDVTGTKVEGGSSRIHLAGGPRLKNIYIGGPNPEDRNLINGQVGIYSRYAEMIHVQGNLIGTDVSGQQALGSGGGVFVQDACPVFIGGLENGEGNVISGNLTHGIELAGNDGCNTVWGNLIGLAADGQTPLGNEGSGIFVGEHASVQIDRNQIAYNLGNGLTVLQSNYGNDTYLPNRIFNNGGLGIDLNNDGVTPNDSLDVDSGPNGLQNYPILESVTYTADSVYVTGELHSKPNQYYELVFFTNQRCDASGYGEGEAFAKTITVWTDVSGTQRFATAVPIEAERPFITVTAALSTLFDGTSEFSNCRADPRYLVTLLQDEVQQLVDEGKLANSTGARLLARLDHVAALLLAGEDNTAVLRLRDFIASVNTLMNRRQLDRNLGQPLIDAAWEIIRQIAMP